MTTTKRTRGQEIVEAWLDSLFDEEVAQHPYSAQYTNLAARIDVAIAEAEEGARQGCLLECSEDEVVQTAIAAEREACARLFDDEHSPLRWLCLDNGHEEAAAIAAAIRARGGKE